MTFNKKEWKKQYCKSHKIEFRNYDLKYRKLHKDKYKEGYDRYNRLHKRECKEYHNSHKKETKEYNKKYKKAYYPLHKFEINKQNKEWKHTKKGKESIRKNNSIYRRCKKWIPILPNIFPENISVDYHHVDGNWFVVPIPSSIHEKVSGRDKNKIQHLEEANDWVEFYYDLNPMEFLYNKE